MSYLLDTSVVVAALTSETHTVVAQAWLTDHRNDALWISDWGLTECSAALSFKVRTGQLAPDRAIMARAVLEKLVTDTIFRIPVTSQQFRLASELASNVAAGLRAGDALHLGTAKDVAATMITLDIGMSRAAGLLGIRCELLVTT